jgi:hypothetical protein
MTAMRAVMIALGVSGCTYTAGSFAHGLAVFPKERVTVGCLDLAVERREDMEGGAVLVYRFGNRCDRPAMVDLAGAVVIGRDVTGQEVQLAPFDPRQEIRPMKIDARLAGREVIAYPSDVELQQVCVNAATITRQESLGAQASGEQWMCFARPAPSQDVPEDSLSPSESVAPNEQTAVLEAP